MSSLRWKKGVFIYESAALDVDCQVMNTWVAHTLSVPVSFLGGAFLPDEIIRNLSAILPG